MVLDDDVFIGGSAFVWRQGGKEFEWVEDKGYVEWGCKNDALYLSDNMVSGDSGDCEFMRVWKQYQ